MMKILAVASLLANDVATEIVFPLLPEGPADGCLRGEQIFRCGRSKERLIHFSQSRLKLWSGSRLDRVGHRKEFARSLLVRRGVSVNALF